MKVRVEVPIYVSVEYEVNDKFLPLIDPDTWTPELSLSLNSEVNRIASQDKRFRKICSASNLDFLGANDVSVILSEDGDEI